MMRTVDEPSSANLFAAVVVCYYPAAEYLTRLIGTLSGAVGVLWLIDNSPVDTQEKWELVYPGVRVIRPGKNIGVASAYNLAAEHTTREYPEIKGLFLFDQDSAPGIDCLNLLEIEFLKLIGSDQGQHVLQIGPAYYEKRREFYPPLILAEGASLKRVPLEIAGDLTKVSYMISSGSLVSLGALQRIGGFDERLFIDYVDVEFGLRGQSRGYTSWILKAACMEHEIGEKPLRIGCWSMPSHSALRRRYQARNAILLMRRKEIPLVWKLHELSRFPVRFIFMALSRNGLPGQLSGWLRGGIDGVLGVDGPVQH